MTLFKGSCHIELIIDSLSLSILFSPNSNSFPLNSNIPDAQRIPDTPKIHFCTPTKKDARRHTKSMLSMYREIHPNLPVHTLRLMGFTKEQSETGILGWCHLYYFCHFCCDVHFRIHRCANSFTRLIFLLNKF